MLLVCMGFGRTSPVYRKYMRIVYGSKKAVGLEAPSRGDAQALGVLHNEATLD